mgnify:CR=1 FL=1
MSNFLLQPLAKKQGYELDKGNKPRFVLQR